MAVVLVYVELRGTRRRRGGAGDAGRGADEAAADEGGLPAHPIPHPSSLAALAAGRSVARSWGATLYAAVIVHDQAHSLGPDTSGQIVAADEVAGMGDLDAVLGRAGADKVLVALTDAEVTPLWASVGATWTGVLDHLRPRLVLFGAHAPATAELGARTGARIGARLLPNARAITTPHHAVLVRAPTQPGLAGPGDIELRDRDGAYLRLGDSGATVALIADAIDEGPCDDDVDLVVLAIPGAEGGARARRASRARRSRSSRTRRNINVVALGDDALDPGIVASAHRLAELIGGYVVGGPAAAAAGAIAHAAVFERNAPLAPDVCIALGSLALDLAGATSIIRIGPTASAKTAEGALTGPIANGVEDLIRAIEAT